MKIPVSWLSDYVSPLPPTDTLAEKLTMLGLEVDSIERTGAGLEEIVVGKILERNPHPDADRLTFCKVTIGSAPLEIVCGATNHKVGDYVAVALPGTTLPNGVKLKKSKIRGVTSEGMMCSKAELGLGEDHSGIIILDGEPKVGSPFVEAYGLADEVIDIDLTPNRGDCLSLLGIAREVAAAFDLEWKRPKVMIGPNGNGPKITNEAPEQCPRYCGILIEGVTIGPSPSWLVRRLERAGLRSINNVVDISNYVMLEYGQPPHAFDADTLIGGEIIVRMARAGESISVIDGTKVDLTPDDLVIADARRPVALAGVMGGAETEVNASTMRILLENAFFSPIPIRRKARRHNIVSEAAHRFERGVNMDAVVEASWRGAQLIVELAGGTIRGGATVADGPQETLQPYLERKVQLRPSRTTMILGHCVSPDQIKSKMEKLGVGCTAQSDDRLEFLVPAHRHDLEREIDLIEEVARTIGYDTIPSEIAPRSFTGESRGVVRTEKTRTIAQFLAARAWRETVTYSFVPREILKDWSEIKPPKVANPLSLQQEVMRSSLVPSLLHVLTRNIRRGLDEIALFEIARVYGERVSHGFHAKLEPTYFAGVMSASREPHWRGGLEGGGQRDFFDVKGDIDALLSFLGVQDRLWQPTQKPMTLHPGFSARLILGEKDLGYLGVLHPDVVGQYELPAAPVVFEFDLDVMLQDFPPSAVQQPSEFPAVTRDLALLVPDAVSADAIERAIVTETGPLLESCRLFDIYTGDQTQGAVSLGFRYTLRSSKDTLKEKAVEKIEERILKTLQQELGITRRQ